MDRRKRYMKVLAFVPAIVLVGGFIGCHSGALPWLGKPEPQPDPRPPATLQQPVPVQAPAPEKKPETFLPGSKSINLKGTTIGLTPAREEPPKPEPLLPPQLQPATENKPPPIMLGPKSAPIFNPPPKNPAPNSPSP